MTNWSSEFWLYFWTTLRVTDAKRKLKAALSVRQMTSWLRSKRGIKFRIKGHDPEILYHHESTQGLPTGVDSSFNIPYLTIKQLHMAQLCPLSSSVNFFVSPLSWALCHILLLLTRLSITTNTIRTINKLECPSASRWDGISVHGP